MVLEAHKTAYKPRYLHGQSIFYRRICSLSRYVFQTIPLVSHSYYSQFLPKPSSAKGTPVGTPPPEVQDVIDKDSELAKTLQPLLEQEALLENFIEEAKAQRKFEDVKTLRSNLAEIKREIERVLGSSDFRDRCRQTT